MKMILKTALIIILAPIVFGCQDTTKNKTDDSKTTTVAVTDKPSTHGMLLMGTQTIYASHLPMFHTPHDYQIIISLALSEKEKIAYIEDRKKHMDEKVYTLAPEVFVLPEKVHAKGSFKGNIYRGHFERGGVKILEEVEIKIEGIIYFKKFEKEPTRPENKHYFLFGNTNEQFLAHVITKKPDFDEILEVTTTQNTIKLLDSNKYVSLEFPEKEMREPFSWKHNKAKDLNSGKDIELQKVKQLYLEFGDLN